LPFAAAAFRTRHPRPLIARGRMAAAPETMEATLVAAGGGRQGAAAGAGGGAGGGAIAAGAVSDWLRSVRKTWDAVTRMLASSRFSSAFFAALPSLYMFGVLIYANVQFSKDLSACFVAAGLAAEPASRAEYWVQLWSNLYSVTASNALTRSMNTFVGALTGVACAASLASILAIWQKWPGVLSAWTWTVEVLKDWFIVTFAILLCSWQSVFAAFAPYAPYSQYNVAFFTSLSNSTLGIMVSVLLPAIFVWQLTASVATRQRMIFSGE